MFAFLQGNKPCVQNFLQSEQVAMLFWLLINNIIYGQFIQTNYWKHFPNYWMDFVFYKLSL